ncbi:Ig-like domain-containing protein [Treponema socranskii]|uniref:Ig-like domain-containing protein n=1 Tax=Treponema socranskii TaxID=53419 RepID=UPI003D6F28E4
MSFLKTKKTISKNYGLLTAVFFIAAACILSLFSCEVGLGASVDAAPPSNAITYPPKNAVVRSTFVIAGTCSDDTSVASVTVSITNTGTNTSYGPFQADLAEDKKSWSIKLNKNKLDVPNHPYASWDFPDGKYSVTVYATDASGRNSDTTANAFTIDNTPPVLILTSPSSSGGLEPDKFGRTISLTGTYAEDTDNKIAEMTVRFFKKTDNPADNGAKIGEITLTDIDHMSDNNKYVIAQYFSTPPSNSDEQKLFENYKAIFGEPNVNNYTANGTAVDSPVYMTLLLSDGARVYDDPSNPAGSGPGNRTTHYYRNTDGIIDTFTKTDAAYPMSIFEIKDFLNGTSAKYTEATAVTNIKNALDEAKSAEYKAEDTPLADTTKATTLSINPKANPTFIVAGYEKTASGSSAYNSNGFPYCTDGAPFNITISSGPDNVPIQYTGDKVTIYSVPADTDGNYSSPLPADWTTSTEPPSSLPAGWVKIANITGQSNKAAYTMTANPVAPATSYGLSPNTLYRFAVWGRDINGIAIEDGTGGPYVCVVKPTGNVPEIKDFKAEVNTSPAVNVGGKYVNKAMTGKTLTVTAKVSDGVSLGLTDAAIQANIIAKAKLGGIDYTASDLTITKEPSGDKKSAVVKFKLTIPSDGTKDGKWTFTLSAKNKDGVSSDTQSIELTVDTVDPTWKTDNTQDKPPYISPTQADNWYNTTALKVKAFAEDGGSGIDKLQYKLSSSPDLNDVGNGNFAFSCDSSLNGTLTVYAVDKAGNKADQVIPVKIDTAAPDTCALTGVDGGAAVDVKLINNTTTGVTFTFTASDAGPSGINPTEIKVIKIGNTVLSPAISASESGGTYTATVPKAKLTDGAVTVRLTDNAGNTADFPLFTLVKDVTPPTVKINTPSASATVNKTITVSGTAFDSREIADKVEVFIKTGPGSDDWTKYNTEPPIADGVWTFTLDTNDTASPASGGIGTYDSDGNSANGRQLTFKITAKDAAGNVGSEERTITVDQNADRPVIRFTNLKFDYMLAGTPVFMTAANPVWFKGADTIYGSITDDDGEVQSFKYFIGDNSPNDSDWTDIPISGGSWNLTLPDGSATIWFKVKDAKAGEFTSTATESTSAPMLYDGTTTFGEGAHPDSKLYLKVDTHAPEMRNVQISRNGTDWSSDFEKVNGKDLLLGGKTDSGDPAKGGSEKFYIKFEAKDANGIDKNNLFVKVSNLKDNGTDVPEHTYTTATVSSTDQGKTHINVTSGSPTPDGWTEYKFDAIPCITGSGTMQLDIVATDTAGNKFPISRNAKVDNTAPKVEFSSPTTVITSGISPTKGTARVAGEIDDSTAKVEYAISPNGEKSPASDSNTDNSYTYADAGGVEHTAHILSFDSTKTAYKDVKDISPRWYIMFDDDMDTAATGMHSWTLNKWLIHLGITTQNEIDGIPPAVRYEKITRLYVWIKATDAHGNTKEYKFPIWHDPQGDRPSVTIDYPVNNAKLGGTVRLAGNATDNNNPTAVFVQILSGDAQIAAGAPTAAELTNLKNKGYDIRLMSGSGSGGAAWTGAPASGKTVADYGIVATLTGGSWSLTINENGEFNPSGNEPNKVKITAYAYDVGNNKSLPKSVNVTFDKNNPVFENIQLVKSSGVGIGTSTPNSAQQTTASGGDYSVKGTWYIYGTVKDGDGIKKLTIKDGTTVHTLITGGNAASSSGNWTVNKASDGKTATFKYKLNTAAGVGKCPIEIEAYDATSQEYSAKYTLTIKYDNQAPVLLTSSETGYNIDANISQSDSFYTFGSKVREDAVGGKAQSGFKRLAFFFMRRSSASNAVIYDPMLEKSDLLNKHAWNASDISYYSGLYWKEYGGVSWNSSTPELLTLSSKDKNVHTGGLVQANGTIYRIESVSSTGTGITLDTALAANPGATVKVALALVVDHLSAEGGVSSLEADGYYSPVHLINDDGDRMIESVSKSGTEWTWEASICSRNIPDGPIELHYVAFDEAGNYSVGIVGNVAKTSFQGYTTPDASETQLQSSAYAYDSAKPAFVSNNRPRIAGVTFGTDYNGNGTIETEEKITAYRAHQTKAEYDADNGDNVPGIKSLTGFTGADKAIYDPSGKQYKYPGRKAVQLTTDLTLDVKADMTVRGYTEITPEIVGGNGAIYYQYDLSGIGTGVNTTAFIASGTTDYTIAEGTIKLQVGDILKLSGAAESVKELSFRFWDSTEGAAALTTIQPLPIDPTAADIAAVGRQSAKLKVKMKFAGKTLATPTSEIQPFYWNSENNNSLFGNSKENGHIEVENGLPAAFTGSTGVMDRDPKVSGQIVMRGTAHDDRFIEGLYISVPGMESVFTSAGLTTTKTVDSVTYYRIADGSSGHLTGTDKWSDGFKFEVSDEKIGKGGHDAKWTFSWDTSKISDVAKADVEVHVLAYNKGTPTCATASAGALSVDGTTHYAAATYNTPIGSAPSTVQTTAGTLTNRYRMDVVPYITSVSRNSTYNTNRARSGAIPLLREETGNTLTGFNFADGSGTSLKITEHKNGSGSAVTVGPLSLSGSSFTFKVPDTAKDGYLHLVVNNVPVLNNMNGYVESNKEKSDTYGTAKHSDDRLVHIWRVNKEDTFKGSKNAIYPAMSKGADGTLYASFSNYSKSEVYYSSAFTGTSAVEVGGTGTTTLFTGYDPPEETDITVSGTEVNVFYAANYHGGTPIKWGLGVPVSPWNDTNPENAGGIYLYDKDAVDTWVGNYNSAKIYRFELFTYDNELQQFKNIRTVRSGNNIYVVYYDRLSGAVKFAWVDDSKTPNTSVNALPWCVIDGNPDVTDTNGTVPDHPADSFTFVSPDGSTYASPYVLSNFEDSLSVSNAVWESIAVATTKDGYPVVVYMDSATGGLRLARSTSKQPKSSSDWTIQKVLASSDPNGRLASNYIRAGIGTDGHLHIAFQNTKGQLVYVKSTNTSDNGSTKYAFGTSEVLDDSGMSIDMTMNGATPYISYVSRPNSYDAIRIAYKTSMDFNNTGTDVEGWETMTAPLNERAANSRICIETQAKHYVSSGTASKMPVAVGFTTGSDYRAAFYVGK